MSDKLNIVIRDFEALDFNFIISSWLKSYRFGSYFAKRIRNSTYYKYHHAVISRILSRNTAKVIIAADALDPKVIYGYLVTEVFQDGDIIHYIYVKESFRGMGVAADLIKASGLNPDKCVFTHMTEKTTELMKKFTGLDYVPYLI